MTEQYETARLFCIGLSYQTAPVGQRECFAAIDGDTSAAYIMALPSVSECVQLSTCNRVEWYLAAHDNAESVLASFCAQIGELSGLSAETVRGTLAVHADSAAATRLFRVAAGLESMVVGESEILGQISRAYMHAIQANTLGPLLDTLFRGAIRAGKRVRAQTDLGSHPASVSSVALDLAARQLGDLTQRNILVIGLGEMGMLTQKLLRARSAPNVVLMNRTLERARVLAEPGWTARPLAELPAALADADLVITATSAPHPIVTVQAMARAAELRGASAAAARGRTPWVLIDLAVPRDVAPEAARVPGVVLYDLDGLHQAIDRAILRRAAAIPAAQEIVAEEVVAFQARLRELEVRPLVVELRSRADMIREQELARTLRYLGDVEPDTVAHLQHLTRALVNKLLHTPTVRIKEMAHDERGDDYLSTVCDLYGLNSSNSLT